MARYRVGTDIGGTFTDLCVLDEENGEIFNSKVSTTPAELTRAVMEAIEQFFHDRRSPQDASLVFHATTVATNALLELKGGQTWLVITDGFTGVYETPEL